MSVECHFKSEMPYGARTIDKEEHTYLFDVLSRIVLDGIFLSRVLWAFILDFSGLFDYLFNIMCHPIDRFDDNNTCIRLVRHRKIFWVADESFFIHFSHIIFDWLQTLADRPSSASSAPRSFLDTTK